MDASPPHQADSPDSARLTYEHVKMLWDDQVDLANTLRDKRKTISPLLALLVGLGLFRLSFYRDPGQVLAVGPVELRWLVGILSVSGVLFLLGTYFLYSERPNLRRFLHWCCHSMMRGWRWIRTYGDTHPRFLDFVKLENPPPSPWPVGRAIGQILDDEDDLNDWFRLEESDLWKTRALRLRAAYLDLTAQNKRVHDRLKNGVACLLLGYVLIFVSLLVYLWTMW